MVVLAAALVTVVRRGEEGIRLSNEIERLEDDARIAADRVVAQRARVDSLTSLPRIEDVAGSFGLRQAVDSEMIHVRDADADGPQDRGDSRVEASGVGGDR